MSTPAEIRKPVSFYPDLPPYLVATGNAVYRLDQLFRAYMNGGGTLTYHECLADQMKVIAAEAVKAGIHISALAAPVPALPAPAVPALPEQAKDYEALYHELLYAVARKHQGESRHQTALRYIREREQPSGEGAKSSLASKGT